jgi:hypothetical protein
MPSGIRSSGRFELRRSFSIVEGEHLRCTAIAPRLPAAATPELLLRLVATRVETVQRAPTPVVRLPVPACHVRVHDDDGAGTSCDRCSSGSVPIPGRGNRRQVWDRGIIRVRHCRA